MQPHQHKVSPKNGNCPIALSGVNADRIWPRFHRMYVAVSLCCHRPSNIQDVDMASVELTPHKNMRPPAFVSVGCNTHASIGRLSVATSQLHTDQTGLFADSPGSD